MLTHSCDLCRGSRSFLSMSWDTEDDFLDTMPEPPPSSQTRNQQDFPNFVGTMQRYGVSFWAGTALAKSLLQELGLANENNFLGRHKVSSMIERHGRARIREHRRQKNMLCPKFDGRKDLTLIPDHQLIQEECSGYGRARCKIFWPLHPQIQVVPKPWRKNCMILSQRMGQTSQFRSLELMAQVSTLGKGMGWSYFWSHICSILCNGTSVCFIWMDYLWDIFSPF